jgi:hypothetical protein
MLKLSNGDVTSGLAGSPLCDSTMKLLITCEQYTIDMNHVLNTDKKQCSLYGLVTTLSVSNAS